MFQKKRYIENAIFRVENMVVSQWNKHMIRRLQWFCGYKVLENRTIFDEVRYRWNFISKLTNSHHTECRENYWFCTKFAIGQLHQTLSDSLKLYIHRILDTYWTYSLLISILMWPWFPQKNSTFSRSVCWITQKATSKKLIFG